MTYSLWINGKPVAGESTFDVINPADKSVVAACPKASADQLEQAVAAAEAAFPAWAAKSWQERSQLMNKLADAVEANMSELSELLTKEQGKPQKGFADMGAGFEMGGTLAWIRATAGMTLPVETIQQDDQVTIELHRKPLGVVGSITPWNYPLLIGIWHIIPAMLTGNTVVMKPSSMTPLTTLRFAELANQILPPGVLNVVTGDGDIGRQMSGHPSIAKIVFTGSTPTGRNIMKNAADDLKRLTLELGGNDAAIVLDDADIESSAGKIFDLVQAASEEPAATLEVAFFGKISTGKSSLIQTILPDARIDTSIIGGSTTRIERYHYEAGNGLGLTLYDMPGTNQAEALPSLDDDVLTATRRVHLVVYVLDQDITASDQQAITQLDSFGKPLIVTLNKSGRYEPHELDQLEERITGRIPEGVTFVRTDSAHERYVTIRSRDGSTRQEPRIVGGDIHALLEAFDRLGSRRAELAERQRGALLHLANEALGKRVTAYRRERGEAMVKAYARKAMLGGVAAVGPGTDILIQGYLGVDMMKSLTKLYDVPVKEVDLQMLVESASGKVKSQLTVILALAGNVCKAFPGLGTVLGGASHAVAYGLIFESLGRAALVTLESNSEQFSTGTIMQHFEEQLHHDLEQRAKKLVSIAVAGRQESGQGDSAS